MSNTFFQFKQFIIHQERCAMKVTTDSCLFGAWVAGRVNSRESLADSHISLNKRMLDMGAGTGLLSLMVAQKNTITIDAVEIDKDAFEQASANINASPWAERIKNFHADVKEFLFPGKYDYIISNPPFYENELKSDDSKKNLAHHQEGLLLTDLLMIIKKNLNPGGSFFLLLPCKRNEEIRKLFMEHDLSIRQLTFVRQSIRHDYFRIMLEGTIKTGETAETTFDEMAIKNDTVPGKAEEYTPAFINLLKEYYLHL